MTNETKAIADLRNQYQGHADIDISHGAGDVDIRMHEKVLQALDSHCELLEEVEKLRADKWVSVDELARITNKMKAECHGEFFWKEESKFYDEDGFIEDVTLKHEVSWDLVKQIYKNMLAVKLSETQPPESEQKMRAEAVFNKQLLDSKDE